MIVSEQGRFLTQREVPRLALIEATLTPSASGNTTTSTAQEEHQEQRQERRIVLRAPSMPEISALLPPSTNNNAAAFSTMVWDDEVSVVPLDESLNAWLSEFIGIRCSLVQMASNTTRLADPRYAARPTDQTVFADGYAVLLTNAASLDNLNTHLVTPDAQPVPMTRFRPNIVVEGAAAWAEDTWKTLRIGDVVFDVVKPCGRCIITTIDQETAIKSIEPLPTLKRYRRSSDGTKVLFGQNLTLPRAGIVRVGDVVEVLETRLLS
jgi:uncharacterized protein YcbX